MNGRLEKSQKEFATVDKIVSDMPEYVKEWFISLRAAGKSSSTCVVYAYKIKQYLKSITPYYKNLKPTDLTSVSFNNFMISLRTVNGREASKSQINSTWSCLYAFFEFLFEENYIEKNPIKRSSRPGGSDEARINENRVLLTKRDFLKILDSVEYYEHESDFMAYRDMAIMRMFMCTGLRKSAITTMDMENVNLETGELFVKDKGDVDHKFVLTKECLKILNSYVIERENLINELNIKEPTALFLSKKGNRIGTESIDYMVAKYTLDGIGKELTPHKLRAGVCSILYKDTKDIEFVRRFIGHSDVSITKRYVVTGGDEITKGHNILEGIIG